MLGKESGPEVAGNADCKPMRWLAINKLTLNLFIQPPLASEGDHLPRLRKSYPAKRRMLRVEPDRLRRIDVSDERWNNLYDVAFYLVELFGVVGRIETLHRKSRFLANFP